MEAPDLFVFAGAGLSVPEPSGLPSFSAIRDNLLEQIDLWKWYPGDHGLITQVPPEPFFEAIARDTDVQSWLAATLSSECNIGHEALAQMAAAGAAVWTVNFDELIETAAGGTLQVTTLDDDPSQPGQLFKPHGTITGSIIVTSDAVIRGLDHRWEQAVRDQVRDRIVIFIGYSGRDIDFRPVWDDVLGSARKVVWYAFDDGTPGAAHRAASEVRSLLPTAHRAGLLDIRCEPQPVVHLVTWLASESLVKPSAGLLALAGAPGEDPTFPALQGDHELAVAQVLSIVGALRQVRRIHRSRLLAGPRRRASLRRLIDLQMHHGGAWVARALWVERLVPPTAQLRQAKDLLNRRRVTIYGNLARHDKVLRLTRRIPPWASPTTAVVRTGTLKYHDLADAVSTGLQATTASIARGNPVLVANAAYQTGVAMLWRGDIAGARSHVVQRVRPYAEQASNRWLAWAEVLDACVSIHESAATDRQPSPSPTDPVIAGLARAIRRFDIERLTDGEVSARITELTRLRQLRDDAAFRARREELAEVIGSDDGTYYARGHDITFNWITLEDADFALHHDQKPVEAARHYDTVTRSPFRLQAALAHIQLAGLQPMGTSLREQHADLAEEAATAVKAASLVGCSQAVRRTDPGETFFP